MEWAYTLDADKTEVQDGSTLTEAYYESRLPVVKERLVAGGLRLGATLQAILDPPNTTTYEEYHDYRPTWSFLSVFSSLKVGLGIMW